MANSPGRFLHWKFEQFFGGIKHQQSLLLSFKPYFRKKTMPKKLKDHHFKTQSRTFPRKRHFSDPPKKDSRWGRNSPPGSQQRLYGVDLPGCADGLFCLSCAWAAFCFHGFEGMDLSTSIGSSGSNSSMFLKHGVTAVFLILRL